MTDRPTFDQPGWTPQVVYNVAGDLKQGAPAPGPPAPASAIPIAPNQVFVGRDDELRRLAELLERPNAVVVIAGLGGVGKTQLAAEFAHACAADTGRWPGGVAWIPMSDPNGVGSAVAGAGRALGVAGYDALPFLEQIEAVRREWTRPTRRLLVFDNCEDPALLKGWRPTAGGARVLVTARRADWPPAVARTLKLGELPRAAARELLVSARAATLDVPPERLLAAAAADAICAELGDLALAIHMAAAYLAAAPLTPLAGYLADLRARSLDHESLRTLDDSSPTEHLQHVAQTFALSYKLLTTDDPFDFAQGRRPTTNHQRRRVDDHARYVLDLAAHCAPAVPIPLDLLRCAATPATSKQSAAKERTSFFSKLLHRAPQTIPPDDLTNAAIQRLVAIGLASYADEGQALAVHRLVAAYARRGQDADAAADLVEAVALALRSLTYEVNEAGLPARMLSLLPHARHAADAAEERGSEHAAVLLNNLGYHSQMFADLAEARALYERALRIDEVTYGPDHPNVAIRVNNLGMVAQDQGDLAAARALFERALRIDEATYGLDYPNVAIDVNNLGMVARNQGDLAAARALLERALRIFEQKLGPEHPNTRRVRGSLAVVVAALEGND
jgi:Tfp pilus assembly protein PilF